MPLYSYKALNIEGKTIRGKISAANELELEAKLKQSHLDLISANKASDTTLSFLNPIEISELILICIHLHQLEKAGVPILDSIGDLRDTSDNPAVRQVMMDLYDSLKNGKLLSVAMKEHPKIFDHIFTGLVAAGEKTGNFSEVFEHLEHHYRWIFELRKKLKKATYYPTFLLFLMMGVVALMMVFVIPKLTQFLLSQNIDLPFYTTSMIATSSFVANYWKWIIFTPLTLYLAAKVGSRFSKKVHYNFDLFKLHLPVIGPVLRKIEIARFCHFFAITFKSGIGILDCLDIATGVVQNQVIKETIIEVKGAVSDGKKITQAIADSGQFPALVVRMFKVGEESGNLDQSLANINEFYDGEINTSIDNMVGVMQPALTIIMGAMMMWITLAVFGPIYGSFGAVR